MTIRMSWRADASGQAHLVLEHRGWSICNLTSSWQPVSIGYSADACTVCMAVHRADARMGVHHGGEYEHLATKP